MSYIDSQIRELREIAEMYEGMDGGELLKECADTIESLYKKLNEKSNGSWIPCSERLPDKDGEYICTQKIYNLSNGKLSGKFVELVEFCNGKWRRAKHLKVIAWQPLPEAYHG